MQPVLVNPQDLVAQIQAALEGEDLGAVEQAQQQIEMLLQLDRNNVGLVFCMGAAYMRQGRYAIAEHWYRRALEMKPDFAEAYNNLGFVCEQEGRREESQANFRKSLELKPGTAEFMNNIATAYINNGTPDEALEWCNRCLEVDPGNLDAKWNASLAYLEKGEWAKGWDYYAAGLEVGVRSSMRRKRRIYRQPDDLPYYDGSEGANVVVYGEQGVGDEIMAASMLPDLVAKGDVVYEAHPRLLNIMRHNFGDQFPIYGTRKVSWQELTWPKRHQLTHKAPIIQLGQHFRRSADSFPKQPYLKPFDNLVDKYREKLRAMGDRPKIGFSWKGGSVLTRNDLRSLPLQAFAGLIKNIDADWISLQYDPADRPGWNTPIVASFEKEFGASVNHWPDVANNLDECYGGLIHALDLVISVNTSLVHACGAYGVQCWTLTPSRPAWRYGLTGREMPWYGPHVQQFRQNGDDWRPVLLAVQQELAEKFGRRAAA